MSDSGVDHLSLTRCDNVNDSENNEIQNNINSSTRFHVSEDIWYKFCRICATHCENLIPLFEGEGLNYDLALKICKHLPFKVLQDDSLPKQCCHQCASLIISWDDLINISSKANIKLNKMLHCYMNEDVNEYLKVQPEGNEEITKLKVDPTLNSDGCGGDGDDDDDDDDKSDKNIFEKMVEGTESRVCEDFIASEMSEDVISTTFDENYEDARNGEESEVIEEKFEIPDATADNDERSTNNEIDEEQRSVTENGDMYCDSDIFELRNDDDHIATIVRRLDDGKRTDKRKREPEVEPGLQAYKLHQPMKYLLVNGCQYLRTKVFGFEPESTPEDCEDLQSLYFRCCICREVMKNDSVINHSKSHYPLKITDSCQMCHFGFSSIDCFRNHLKKHTVLIDEEYKELEKAEELSNLNQIKEIDKSVKKLISDIGDSEKTFDDFDKKIEVFVCEYCGLTYNSRKIFLQHIRRVHVSPFICKLCRRRFSNKGSLKKHRCVQVVSKRPDGKIEWYNCRCKKIFLFEEQYLNHKTSCEKAKYIPCDECGCEFSDKTKLDTHVLRQHIRLKELGQKPPSVWICEICGCHLSTLSAKKHYLTHSFSEKKFTCEICAMKFSDKNSLEKHVQSHSSERPFTCNICNATFKRKDHVKIHMKNKHNIFDDVKKYQCRKCKRHFTTQSYLIRHQRLHSQGVSYECLVCKSRFPTEHSLKMHQTRTKHDAVKDSSDATISLSTADWVNRFRCNICNQRYGSITSLRKHALIHSQKNVVKEMDEHEKNCVETEQNNEKNFDEGGKKLKIIENIHECPKCFKRYLSEFGLKLHLARSKHAPINSKSKKKPKVLSSVLSSEKNPRFKCSECNEIFGSLLSLKMHKIKRKHFSKCPSCDKRFALDFKLRNHLIKVHQRRDIDEKMNEFTQSEIMPFQCGYCQQKFAMHHNLLAHMQKKHDKIEDEIPTPISLIYLNSDAFEQKIAPGETPVIYHCTDCWDNFLTEDDFHNHTHETTENVSNQLNSDISNVVTSVVGKPDTVTDVE
ncbi:uncharacterized protein LOC142324866 isoform X2 [Lycorma delicatula]|uniref:uncharacterized protein LOC142324866 isoform X2 n=1 Tax=Lycorma delicatula TaxID=130591 RepID=UPI003F511B16